MSGPGAAVQLRRCRLNDIGAYADFVAFVARRYPRAVIEPWNEPNVRVLELLDVGPTRHRVARMQCAAFDADPRDGLDAGRARPRPQRRHGQRDVPATSTRIWTSSGAAQGDGPALLGRPRDPRLSAIDVDGDGTFTALAVPVVRQCAVGVRRHDADLGHRGRRLDERWAGRGPRPHPAHSRRSSCGCSAGTTNELLSSPDVYALSAPQPPRPADRRPQASEPAHVEYGFGMLRKAAAHAGAEAVLLPLRRGGSGNTYPGC